MQFGKDWPGVFIHGDDALSYLSVLIAEVELRGADLPEDELGTWPRIVELRDLLVSCRTATRGAPIG